MKQDLYEILGVKRDCSKEEIREAWKGMSKRFHPDNAGGDQEKMSQINEAYEILYDETSRTRYDKTGTVKDVPFETRFHATIGPLIAGMVDVPNPENLDLIKQLTESITTIKNTSEQQLKTLTKRISNAQTMLGRLTSDSSGSISAILNGILYDSQKTQVLIEEDLLFLSKVLEVLNTCGYDFTAAEERWLTGGNRFTVQFGPMRD